MSFGLQGSDPFKDHRINNRWHRVWREVWRVLNHFFFWWSGSKVLTPEGTRKIRCDPLPTLAVKKPTCGQGFWISNEFLTSKNQLWDKEIVKFRSQKAKFPDNPWKEHHGVSAVGVQTAQNSARVT